MSLAKLSKSARRVARSAQSILMASLAVNVLVATILCVLLSPGILFDYSGPDLLPKAGQGLGALNMTHLKHGVIFALALGLLDVGIGAVLGQMLKASMFK